MNKPNHCWRCEAICTQQCSRCKVAYYCSKECQKQDKWRHQPECETAALKLQCSACDIEQEGLMKCTNCLKACYCSVECQRSDWKRHKTFCHDAVDKTLKLAQRMKEFHEMKKDNTGLGATYYWGNIPAVDPLNLSMNEGEDYSNSLALLLCGVGDPRNVLLTTASLPDVYTQQVSFVLNDICPCTLARTVLLLYMLYKGGADVTSAVVRIWYSVRITKKDFTLLTLALQDLAATAEPSTLTDGLMEISASQLSQLKIVWSTWLCLSEQRGPWVEDLRKMAIRADSGREDGLSHYLHAIPKVHRASAQHFFDTGIFLSTKMSDELTQQNPTLTGRGLHRLSSTSEFYYSIPTDVLPFTAWDYKAAEKTCYDKSLPIMYTKYLSEILHRSSDKMSRCQVKFYFILCDFLNIDTFLPEGLRYDRVLTSNLWDYYPLKDVLTKFKRLLNSTNPHAVILTETQNWPRNYMPEIVHQLPYYHGLDDLLRKALKDTQDPELVEESGLTTVVEYINLSDEFLLVLHASLLASCTENELALFKKQKKIPSVKSLVNSLGLYLRDFVRNENTVVPFRWAVNCRRVVMLRGYERALELKLISD